MRPFLRLIPLLLVAASIPYRSLASEPATLTLQLPASAEPMEFLTDYHAALDAAQARDCLALLWFFDPGAALANVEFTQHVLARPDIQSVLREKFVVAKLPVTATVMSGGEEVELLKHSAFAEMLRAPGLAIVDMTDEGSPLFRQVVSVFPFNRKHITREQLSVLLDLPLGSLTQRTLVFAVRAHPEHPQSTLGHLSQILTRETENHAWHQARITLQGHHNWDSRFHAINAQLPGGLLAREVCAESWPGQTLVEAAEECVHSWRQSSGHWNAVSSRHPLFAYDMKRGANGVWYAAGIFANR